MDTIRSMFICIDGNINLWANYILRNVSDYFVFFFVVVYFHAFCLVFTYRSIIIISERYMYQVGGHNSINVGCGFWKVEILASFPFSAIKKCDRNVWNKNTNKWSLSGKAKTDTFRTLPSRSKSIHWLFQWLWASCISVAFHKHQRSSNDRANHRRRPFSIINFVDFRFVFRLNSLWCCIFKRIVIVMLVLGTQMYPL